MANAVAADSLRDAEIDLFPWWSAWWKCGGDDSWLNSRAFTATNRDGIEVSGVACCGWIKACTLRW